MVGSIEFDPKMIRSIYRSIDPAKNLVENRLRGIPGLANDGKTLEIKNVTEGYTKEQIEQNIEMFTEQRNEALYDLYEMKRETLAFNEGGNKQGYEDLLDDTDFFTTEDFTDIYNVKGFTDEQVIAICENRGLL